MKLSKGRAVLALVCAAVLGNNARAIEPVSVSPPAPAEVRPPSLGVWENPGSLRPGAGGGEHGEVFDDGSKDKEPGDLTLGNFFSAGWDEDFTRRDSQGRAPDLALLRVQTNFMEREVRVNYFFQDRVHNLKTKDVNSMDAFIAYAFNRRFMVEVLGNYVWQDARKGPDPDGPTAQLVGRIQLASTAESSYTFNFRVITPNRGLGEQQTTFSYGLAGFEDLTEQLGLYRVGLYYSVLFDSLAGPHAVGARHNDVGYDITIAKTLTDPETPLLGNFSVFVENFAQTDLDGSHSGRTLVTITPGVRFNLGKLPGLKLGLDNWLMGGVDVPVAGPKPWDAIYRFTYIKNF